jgi:hypothetical protein
VKKLHAHQCADLFENIGIKMQAFSSQPSDNEIGMKEVEYLEKHLLKPLSQLCSLADLEESRSLVDRIIDDHKLFAPTSAPINARAFANLEHLSALLKSELEKRFVFVLDREKAKFYVEDQALPFPDLVDPIAIKFASALMDMKEAGRCLALGRNNACVYHLMCVAEIGLRALAYDRQVAPKQKKKDLPIEYAQWGQLIAGIESAVLQIRTWKNGPVQDEAFRFYNSALVEIRSFNDGWRRHFSHARGTQFADEDTVALFANVKRFMTTLSTRISETTRTPLVWKRL